MRRSCLRQRFGFAFQGKQQGSKHTDTTVHVFSRQGHNGLYDTPRSHQRYYYCTVLYLSDAPRTHPPLYHFTSVTLPTILAKHAALGMRPFMLAISTMDASLCSPLHPILGLMPGGNSSTIVFAVRCERRKARSRKGVPQTTKLGLHILELRIRYQ